MGHVFRTEEQTQAVDSLRRFLDRELEPQLKAGGSAFIQREAMVQFTQELAKFGLVSCVVQEAHGGTGLGWLTHLMLFEELAYTSNDLAMVILINSVAPLCSKARQLIFENAICRAWQAAISS
jgi:acyl-CoA dehydrogenase